MLYQFPLKVLYNLLYQPEEAFWRELGTLKALATEKEKQEPLEVTPFYKKN